MVAAVTMMNGACALLIEDTLSFKYSKSRPKVSKTGIFIEEKKKTSVFIFWKNLLV